MITARQNQNSEKIRNLMVALVGVTGATLVAAPAQAVIVGGVGLVLDGTVTETGTSTTFTPNTSTTIIQNKTGIFADITEATVKTITIDGDGTFFTAPAIDAFKVYEKPDGGMIEFDLAAGTTFLRTGLPTAGTFQYTSTGYSGTYTETDAAGNVLSTYEGEGFFNFSQSGADTIANAAISQAAVDEDPDPIPEPMTILGSLVALGFGAAAKRKNNQV